MAESRSRRSSRSRHPSAHVHSALARPRQLHLVDVDNLVGGPRTAEPGKVAATLTAYRDVAEVGPVDLAVLGACGPLLIETRHAWPGALLRTRRGPDGTDLELLEAAEQAAASGRFARVTIGGGDRIYAHAIWSLRDAGVFVTVVAPPRTCADLLRQAADRYIPLPAAA